MARKFADRWLYKTLGGGLHGREVFRREIKDPRKKLYDAVLLANLQMRGKSLPGTKVRGSALALLALSNCSWEETAALNGLVPACFGRAGACKPAGRMGQEDVTVVYYSSIKKRLA